jgi:hypothetical protein
MVFFIFVYKNALHVTIVLNSNRKYIYFKIFARGCVIFPLQFKITLLSIIIEDNLTSHLRIGGNPLQIPYSQTMNHECIFRFFLTQSKTGNINPKF